MNRLLKAAAALLCAVGLSAFASTSNATATITDLDGSVWSNGTFVATITTPTGAVPTISGVPVSPVTVSGSLSNSGILTAALTDTSSVQQSGTTYTFTLCPNASGPKDGGTNCVTISGVSVTGATPNLTSALSTNLKGPRFPAGQTAFGYADSEVQQPWNYGDTYVNVGTTCGAASLRQYSNAGWQCGSTPATSPTSAAIPTTGMLADYHFQDGTGTTVSDSSSNGNNGTANANTTWVANGLDFADQGSATKKLAAVSLPAALNATKTMLLVVYEKPIQKTLMVGQFQLLVTSSMGSSGLNLTSGYVNPVGAFETGYSLSTFVGSSNTTAKNLFSGLHALEFVCGMGGGDKDHLYIDGVEVSYTVQGSSCGAQTTGNLFIGNSGVTPWSTNGQMSATAYRAIFWNTQHTAAQVKAESLAALSEVVSRGVAPVPQPVGAPTLFAIGDSITFGQGVTTPWPSSLTLTNQPSWVVENWGIPSVEGLTVSASETNRIAPRCTSTSGYAPVSIVFLGTNDFNSTGGNTATASVVWSSLVSEVNTLKNAGCRVFIATMISRTGNGTNSQTNDANKNALDALIVGQWKTVGADGLVDFAANPLLGADGAYANATYFQADGSHPTQTGQGLLATAASNTLNYYFSGYSAGTPKVITTATTLASGDTFSTMGTLSGSTAITLPDCTGPTGAVYTIVNPQSAQTVTVQGASASQPVNGLTSAVTIPANSTAKLTIGANPKASSGCFWTM